MKLHDNILNTLYEALTKHHPKALIYADLPKQTPGVPNWALPYQPARKYKPDVVIGFPQPGFNTRNPTTSLNPHGVDWVIIDVSSPTEKHMHNMHQVKNTKYQEHLIKPMLVEGWGRNGRPPKYHTLLITMRGGIPKDWKKTLRQLRIPEQHRTPLILAMQRQVLIGNAYTRKRWQVGYYKKRKQTRKNINTR